MIIQWGRRMPIIHLADARGPRWVELSRSAAVIRMSGLGISKRVNQLTDRRLAGVERSRAIRRNARPCASARELPTCGDAYGKQ